MTPVRIRLPTGLENGGWRTLWRREHEGVSVSAGAIAVLPGTPSVVVVTEELSFDGLSKCDNTNVYRLSDGAQDHSAYIMFKWPFETPRIEVSPIGDKYVSVVNASRGVQLFPATPPGVCWPADSCTGNDTLGAMDRHALDLVTGRRDGQALVVAAWDIPTDDAGPHLRAYDLATGVPVAEQWRLPPWATNDRGHIDLWRLGRWDGRPVAAVFDGTFLDVHCAVTGELAAQFVLADVLPDHLDLLAIDDRSGRSLALLGDDDSPLWCYDLAAEAVYCPPLTGYSGTLNGARLGRWQDRPAAAVLTSTGVSLYDLSAERRTCHLDLGVTAYDVTFVAHRQLAIATATGPMVVEVIG